MKKISILSAICLMAQAPIVTAQTQHTQSLTFNDNDGIGNAGTYNPNDSVSFDIFLTFSGYNSPSLSLWFATTANAAPHLLITQFTWGTTFPDMGSASIATYPMGFTLPQSDGLYANPNPCDFGDLVKDIHAPYPGPGTYFVGNISISLSGLAPGIYVLQSDASNPHTSEVTSFDGTTFADNNLPVSTYTITVVPEPSTIALLIVMAIGGGAVSAAALF